MPSSVRSLLLAAALVGGAALADDAPGEAACRADAQRLCADVQPGGGRIRACMRAKADQVSAECKAHVEARRAHWKEAVAACQPDVARFCADVPAGGGRVMACLREHAAELSDACKATRRERPAARP